MDVNAFRKCKNICNYHVKNMHTHTQACTGAPVVCWKTHSGTYCTIPPVMLLLIKHKQPHTHTTWISRDVHGRLQSRSLKGLCGCKEKTVGREQTTRKEEKITYSLFGHFSSRYKTFEFVTSHLQEITQTLYFYTTCIEHRFFTTITVQSLLLPSFFRTL